MSNHISSKTALTIWADYSPLPKDHLSTEKLYQFSFPGGLKTAEKYDIHHLSLCPQCLSTWKTLCELKDTFQADDYDEKKDPIILSFGLLQAAASRFTEPFRIKSECLNFILGIFPEIGNPEKAMIVLETIGDETPYQGKTARVRDANGFLLLEAKIKQGRAAAKTDLPEHLDLSHWSIIVSASSDKDPHE